MDKNMNSQTKRGMSCMVGGAANALSLSPDNTKIVVAGRSLLKIFTIDENAMEFIDFKNLHAGRRQGLNMSSSDVAWSPNDENLIATAATNGVVVAWDLTATSRSKQLVLFNEHRRTVTKVSFHAAEPSKLLSGSQDGSMKLFDLRKKECTNTFISRADGVRNVQFSPYLPYQFAASFDNGNVQIWDYRATKMVTEFLAHKGSVYTLDWHPNADDKNILATGGRDNMVKIWDLTNVQTHKNHIPTTSSVASVCWRPNRNDQLATAAMMLDFSINVWDLRRRYVPFAYFDDHRAIPTGIQWKHNDQTVLFSCSKDGLLYMHTMGQAVRPGNHTETKGLDISSMGYVCLADEPSDPYTPRSQSPTSYARLPFLNWKSDYDDTIAPATGAAQLRRFLKSQSHLKMMRGRPVELKSCSDLDDQLEAKDTVLEHVFMNGFKYCAKNYKLERTPVDNSFFEVCKHNSNVALKAGKANAARTWLLLSQFYSNDNDNSAISNNLSNGTFVRTFSDIGLEKSKRETGDSKRASLIARKDESHGSQVFHVGTSGGESEFQSEDGRNIELEDYLTDIARGRHSEPSFYLSDEEGIQSFGYDGGTSEADFLTDHEWGGMRVPPEAIVQKEVLDTESIAKFGHVVVPSAVINQSINTTTVLTPHAGRWHATAVPNRGENSSPPSPPEEGSSQVLTEKDLVVKPSLWPDPLDSIRSQLVSEQLEWFAEQSDVQTAVSIMLTLSSFSIACELSVDEALAEHWQFSYLHLLSKYELWVEHQLVVKLSKIPIVRSLSASSTVHISCRICQRRMPSDHSWSCDRRADQDHKNKAASCFLCNLPVTGLYSYCQGCNFGGHSKCAEVWLREKRLHCRNHCV